MVKYNNIIEAYKDLKELKENYNYYQKCQETARHNICFSDPLYNNMDEEQHNKHWSDIIKSNKYMLNELQFEIKEVRKAIKQLNREQNAKNN